MMYPGHGAGSSCGKNIGKETFSTIGTQKQMNYAMQTMSKAEFVKAVTEGLSAAPNYFAWDAKLNKEGYDSIDDVLQKNTIALSVADVETEIAKGALVLDVRAADDFEKGFIPNAINIGLNGQYAPWVGALIDPKATLILVTDEGKESEAVLRLARVGYENVKGFVNGGIASWQNAGKKTESIESVSAETFVANLNDDTNVLDVRKPGEVEDGMIENANHICLSQLQSKLDTLDKNTHYTIHCAGGYRSMMAASIMKQKGFKKITNVLGGMGKIKATGIKLVLPEVV